MHQINISCVFCVRANTVIVLCIPPVRNVHKCESRLIITEQLTAPTSTAIVTATHTYAFASTCMFSPQR